MSVVPALQAAGVVAGRLDRERRVDDRSVDVLELAFGKARARFAIEEKGRAPYPNELPSLEPIRESLAKVGTPLLVAPFVSDPLGIALTRAGWSWADTTGNFDLRTDHVVFRQRSTATRPPTTASRLPLGSGSLAIIRALIQFPRDTDQGAQATALAEQVGVSQPRASQVLHRLLELGLVTRTHNRRWSPAREALLDRFLADYRGPGGAERFAYSLDPPSEVAARVAAHVGNESLAVSADVGPDLVFAWKRPTVVILYVRDVLDLDRLRLVDAQRHAANVIIRTPDDTSVFPTQRLIAEVSGVDIPLADPTQQVWDLQELGGADRLEAAGKLREWLLDRP